MFPRGSRNSAIVVPGATSDGGGTVFPPRLSISFSVYAESGPLM